MLNLGFRTQLTAILAMMPKNVKTFYFLQQPWMKWMLF
jgi:hypothetical protein